MTRSKIGIAVACMPIIYDKKENLKAITSLVDESGSKGADLLIMPETCLQGYCWDAESFYDVEQKKYYLESAEPVPGPSTEIIAEHAKKSDVYVQLGMAERAPVGGGIVVYNVVVLIGPKGVVGISRKIHNKSEDAVFNDGNEIVVWDTPFARLGPVICYDLCFPEVTRIQALKGADMITMSTAWSKGGSETDPEFGARSYDVISKSVAITNQVWLAQSNAVGIPARGNVKTDCYGHSRILSPLGEVVAESVGEGLAFSEIDLKQSVLDARTKDMFGMNMLKDRKPGLYGELCDMSIYES
jgi:predicted amidohydrolase